VLIVGCSTKYNVSSTSRSDYPQSMIFDVEVEKNRKESEQIVVMLTKPGNEKETIMLDFNRGMGPNIGICKFIVPSAVIGEYRIDVMGFESEKTFATEIVSPKDIQELLSELERMKKMNRERLFSRR
jgi:hypothetical protein